MGRWGYAVIILGLVYGIAMLVNIVIPTGVSSPRGALFNYGWLTLLIMALIVVIGAVYFAIARPQRRFARGRHPVAAAGEEEAATRPA